MIYFYLLILISILGSVQKNYRSNRTITYFLVILIVLLSGLRATSVGIDTEVYIRRYLNEQYVEEPLYNLLQYICFKLNLSGNGFIFANALLTYVPLSFVILKKSTNPSYSILLYIIYSVYFYVNSMNVLRNAIACSFFLVFLVYYENRQYKTSIVFALVSSLFHYSAFTAVLIALSARMIKGISSRMMSFLLFSSLIIGQFASFASEILVILLNNFDFLGVITEYSGYIDNVSYNTSNTIGLIMLLAPNIISAYLIYSRKTRNNYFFVIYFIGVIFTNLFIHLQFFYRISLYLVLPLIICLPEAYNKNQLNKIAATLFTILLAIYFICFIMQSDSAGVFPYKFYFQ